MAGIVRPAPADQRIAYVAAQIGCQCADDPPAAPRYRLGALKLDDTLVLGQARHVGLDGGFTDALLTRECCKPELVTVPRIYDGRRLRVRRFEAVGLRELNLHLLSMRTG